MLTTALPLLPPPATSLLPPLHDRPSTEPSSTFDMPHSLQAQQQQRRNRSHPHAAHPRSELAMLAYDERVLTQRKLAIQMYGYSWLKPAGCTKTMLGRREEEIEREEVERQLREVELQERNAAEMEEAERQATLDQQRAQEARGDPVGEDEGERDLDEEVPDMDAEAEFEDEDTEDDEDEDEGDLDGDIPEGDSGWAYDTTRDPDTESEHEQQPSSTFRPRTQQPRFVSGNRPHAGRPEPVRSVDLSMIPDEEMPIPDQFQERDLDDDVPEIAESVVDLDDEVPDADADDGGWQHTDTELEESDMDISIMPPGVTAHHVSMPPPSANVSQHRLAQDSMSSGIRRTSGNVPLPMAPPIQPTGAHDGRRGLVRSNQLPPNFTPDQIGSDISVSALISTGNTDMSSAAPVQAQRSWLDPSSARRNLFGGNRNAPARSAVSFAGSNSTQQAAQGNTQIEPGIVRQASSGGLFTPSPQQQNPQRAQQGMSSMEEPSRTRSGRALGRNRN